MRMKKELAARFTVSVPTRLMDRVDRELMPAEESRSALVRRLLEQALKEAKERADVERWIRSYEEEPQTDEELSMADYWDPELAKEMPWE